MPDADLDRIISELRRKREQLTEAIERLVIRRGEEEDAERDGDAGHDERPAREEPPPRV